MSSKIIFINKISEIGECVILLIFYIIYIQNLYTLGIRIGRWFGQL